MPARRGVSPTAPSVTRRVTRAASNAAREDTPPLDDEVLQRLAEMLYKRREMESQAKTPSPPPHSFEEDREADEGQDMPSPENPTSIIEDIVRSPTPPPRRSTGTPFERKDSDAIVRAALEDSPTIRALAVIQYTIAERWDIIKDGTHKKVCQLKNLVLYITRIMGGSIACVLLLFLFITEWDNIVWGVKTLAVRSYYCIKIICFVTFNIFVLIWDGIRACCNMMIQGDASRELIPIINIKSVE